MIFAATAALVLLAVSCGKSVNTNSPVNSTSATNNANTNQTSSQSKETHTEVVAPISRAKERVTKKPFGIYITPKTSPVRPERFTGFHSGTDFETFPEEANADVAVYAICNGKLASKSTISGYGGVVTQYCTIDNKAVKIIYGHIRLASVSAQVGAELKAGQQIAVLGTGYSKETDGERKHLHLGIIIGQGTSVKGYVQTQAELSGFLDVMKYL